MDYGYRIQLKITIVNYFLMFIINLYLFYIKFRF